MQGWTEGDHRGLRAEGRQGRHRAGRKRSGCWGKEVFNFLYVEVTSRPALRGHPAAARRILLSYVADSFNNLLSYQHNHFSQEQIALRCH